MPLLCTQIYRNGEAVKSCSIFGTLCGAPSQMVQNAGFVAAAQHARRACAKCPGIRPASDAGFRLGMESVKDSLQGPAIPGCPTTSAADRYGNLVGG